MSYKIPIEVNLILDENIESYFQTMLNKQTEEILEKINNMERCDKDKKTEKEVGIEDELKGKIEHCEKELKILLVMITEKEKEIQKLHKECEITNKILEEEKNFGKEKEKRILEMEEEHELRLQKNDQLIRELEKVNEEYRIYFEEAKRIHVIFCKLSEETRSRLSNIFEKDDFWSFIASGVQWDTIEGLWNFIRRKVIEEDRVDTQDLKEIFHFLFRMYNECSKKPMYTLIQPSIGERFNKEKHNILGIKTDGTVAEVELVGYCDGRGMVKNKSLIRVR